MQKNKTTLAKFINILLLNRLTNISTKMNYHSKNCDAFHSFDERFRKLREDMNSPWQNPISELLKAATTLKYISAKPQNQPFCSSNSIRKSSANATLAVTITFVHNVEHITKSQNAPIPTPNTPRNDLPTPVKVNNLVIILEGYEETKLAYIKKGFTVNFSSGCVGVPGRQNNILRYFIR